MAHTTLRDFRSRFDLKKHGDYGWLESRNSAEKTLVLVHGVTGGKDDMLPLAVEYEKLGYHVYCLDLPGHGDSSWPSAVSFATLASWLDSFLKHIGAPDVLVSNSFSSAIVYAYLQNGMLPGKTHVILGCPTPETSRLTTNLYHAGKIVPVKVAWYLYTTWLANGVRTSLMAKQLHTTPIRWLIESERRKRLTIHPHAGITLSTLLFVENPYDGPHIAESVQKRMTIVLGTRDNVVTRRTKHLLRELLPHAKHIPAHKAGHILHFEAVEQLVDSRDY